MSTRKNDTTIEAGAKEPVFASFAAATISGSAKAWEEVLHLGSRRTYAKGTIITPAAEELFDIYYIEKGKMRMSFDSLEGRNRALALFEAGSMFNLACAATHQEASGQFECAEDVVVWHIPGKVLHSVEFIRLYPALVNCVVHQLGTLVLTYHTALTDMLLDDFIIRFCRFLLSMNIKHGSLTFTPGGTQEKIASIFGVHRTTLARAIQHLKREKVIASFTKNRVEILDLQRLRRMASL